MLARVAPSRREALAIAVCATAFAVVCAVRWAGFRAAAPATALVRGSETGLRLDVNRAGWPELEILPGIGERLAQRIVADRARRGPFRSVDDLGRVAGISQSVLAALRPHVVAGPPSDAAAEGPVTSPSGRPE